MKKIFLLFIVVILSSCASNRVCGGSGGKRCVQTILKPIPLNIS